MGRPFDRRSFDAFTATGSGPSFNDQFAPARVPAHRARYRWPPYLTSLAQRLRLRRRGDVP
jgi:hypothetical protein